MPVINYQNWFKIGLFNLILVALYGLLMRYKIAFDFPYLEQRHLLHAHSHFAFAGWITHLLFVSLIALIAPHLPPAGIRKYQGLIVINLISSFGMLVAFTIQGYKAVSIAFSTLSVLVAFGYAWVFIKDSLRIRAKEPAIRWAVVALLAGVISSGGPFTLAWMMSTKNIDSGLYLGSVYYYLHFQYNGWFFFGAMALVVHHFRLGTALNKHFKILAGTMIPTVFLSLLWMNLPDWLYILTVAATLLQLFAWLSIVRKFWTLSEGGKKVTAEYPGWVRLLLCLTILAMTLKFILQTLSVIPSLSQLVFGFRPIVIAYLHLVLLAGYSIFFIGYMLVKGYAHVTAGVKWAIFVFLIGVLLNELLLAIQGFAAFSYLPIPFINESLVGAAVLLFAGATGLWSTQLLGPVRIQDVLER